ncbi:hypothetical protein OHA25_36440 [Nonomuraea sp. NBC_00507]|uniref:hypothetical protein n=1 Tax=Nonomuraea sp. NBC_00507 TaxID=2976002 RepID=UPI002E185523
MAKQRDRWALLAVPPLDPISPSSSDDIDFFGVINVDVEAEPASLVPADGGRCGPRKSQG